MIEGRFCYLFRSIYNGEHERDPMRGATFIGIHQSSDANFASEYGTDPFVGSGNKMKELILGLNQRGHRNIGRFFRREVILAGTMEQCKNRLDQIQIPYDHPLCLNSRVGAPAGVPKSEEHRAAISEALETAMQGNTNNAGQVQAAEVDPSVKAIVEASGKKMKWITDGTNNKLIALDLDKDGVEILPEGWTLGKTKKK